MNKFYCKCSKCGKEVEVDTSTGVTLTTIPSRTTFNYKCDNCGNVDTVRQDEIYLKVNWQLDEGQLCSSCLICGKPVPIQSANHDIVVCNECKDAIKKLKSIIATNEKMGRRFDAED